MALRGKPALLRMLITFCDFGGSSAGMREYLSKHAQKLKDSMPDGAELIAEVRRNHHPEIRAVYRGGIHLEQFHRDEQKRSILETGLGQWRRPKVSQRNKKRRQEFLENNNSGFTRTAAEDRVSTIRRVIEADSDPALTTSNAIQSAERTWPAWKVWGPSGKVVNARNLAPGEIEDRLWWMLRATGSRTTKWGHNVDRHVTKRPSIQGPWTPATAALLSEAASEREQVS